jgi:hypothetical protein
MTEASHLLPILAQQGQPETLFKALDQAMGAAIGHQLFTLLFKDGDEVVRSYSNRPVEYPVAGRKPMGPTPWGDLVMTRQTPFLGRDKAAIRWAFFDHALIESMGLGSVLSLPVVYDGTTLGSISLLHAENFYGESHLAAALAFAPLMIPAFLQMRR